MRVRGVALVNEGTVADWGQMTQEQWGKLKQELLSTVGTHNYNNWIEPLELVEVRDGGCHLYCADQLSGGTTFRAISVT